MKVREWPGNGWVTRVIPPPGDYDRPTMRAYSGRAKPHIVNPEKPTHTLCGKPVEWWVAHTVPVGAFAGLAFSEHGCFMCAGAAGRLGLQVETPDEA